MSRPPEVADIQRDLAALKNQLAIVKTDLVDIRDSMRNRKPDPKAEKVYAAKKSTAKRN